MNENRREERVKLELKTLVQVRESESEQWKEIITVTTVSRSGASFMLSRPVIVGQLVALVLPMPRELRAYDKMETVYPVMGLVQYCNESTMDGDAIYHVGVAFIGKRLPESYRTNPQQSYRIYAMAKNGLWKIKEAETQFTNRASPRYWLNAEVTITLVKKENVSVLKETTLTQNIGERGASVYCSLEAEIGDKVKFGCKPLDFHAFAIVRNRKVAAEGKGTLHLEFIDQKIPMEKIFFFEMAKRAEAI